MKLPKLFILFLFLSLNGFSQNVSSYTLKYDKTEFCAGSNVFVKPTILNIKGEVMENTKSNAMYFSIIKVSGEGNLEIDKDGVIDIIKSSPGTYSITLNNGRGTAQIKVTSYEIKIIICN